jgi:hypothetical protein
MTAEELFLEKYGNKITAGESWVIRFAEEYAKIKLNEVLPQAAVSGSLPLPYLCPACDGECKEHLEPVYMCTVCQGVFGGNDR